MGLLRKIRDFCTAVRRLGRTANQANKVSSLEERISRLEAASVEPPPLQKPPNLQHELAPRLARYALAADVALARAQMSAMKADLERERQQAAALIHEVRRRQDVQSRAYTDVSRTLSLLTTSVRNRLADRTGEEDLRAFGEVPDLLLSAVMCEIDERFHGGWDECKDRLRVYLPSLISLAGTFDEPLSIVDLGCGRGEWLDLLRQEGFRAVGVDRNRVCLEEAARAGLDAVAGDALTYLRAQPAGSIHVVSAIHLVEHLPFPGLADLLREAFRVLVPGGLLLVETFDTSNILSSWQALSSNPDITRLLSVDAIEAVVQTIGYAHPDVLHLRPDARFELAIARGLDPELSGILFGPRDVALLVRRPS